MNDTSTEINKLDKKEYQRQYNHDTYYYRKEHGICVQCGKADALPGKVRCPDCIYKHSLRKTKEYKELTPEKKKKKYDDNKRYYHERKSHGQCVCCKKKATNGIYCLDHCIKNRRSSLRSYYKKYGHDTNLLEFRKDNCLCWYCGSPIEETLIKDGKKACAACCKKHGDILNQYRPDKTLHPWYINNKIVFQKKR